jgi:hypothetical protein
VCPHSGSKVLVVTAGRQISRSHLLLPSYAHACGAVGLGRGVITWCSTRIGGEWTETGDGIRHTYHGCGPGIPNRVERRGLGLVESAGGRIDRPKPLKLGSGAPSARSWLRCTVNRSKAAPRFRVLQFDDHHVVGSAPADSHFSPRRGGARIVHQRTSDWRPGQN